jgi:DNA-binding NarL/FixJ family response regulator
VPIHVRAEDPITQAGLITQLAYQPEVHLVDEALIDERTVGIVAAEVANEATLRLLRSLNKTGCQRFVLVITSVDDTALLGAVDAGVCALVHRGDATPARLAKLAVQAAAGKGAMPTDILGRLLKHVSRLQHNVLSPMGLNLSGLSTREIDVLRLVADGLDTQEIARELRYSERTVKSILHDVTSRFQLRNRSHAVAYAMREGLI